MHSHHCPLPTPLRNYSERLSLKDLPREEPQTCLANIFPPLPGYRRGGKEEMFKLLRMHLLGVPKGRQVEKGTSLTSTR